MALEMKYFVLKPWSKIYPDPHGAASRAAMRTYAWYVDNTDPNLARDLRLWAAEGERYYLKLREAYEHGEKRSDAVGSTLQAEAGCGHQTSGVSSRREAPPVDARAAGEGRGE